MTRTILLVALGGGIGSALRYLTSVFVSRFFAGFFPMATLLANVAGCFLIGLFSGWLAKEYAGSDLKYILITGFCGGYTTFSAFGIENLNLIQNGNLPLALFYTTSSIAIGISAVFVGMHLAR